MGMRTGTTLTSYEKTQLAHFLVQTAERQQELWSEALHNPKVSGPYIHAMRWLLENT